MSDGSSPHIRPEDLDEAPPSEEPEGARVIEFPSEEAKKAPLLSVPVPAGTWADEENERGDPPPKPADVIDWGGGEVVEFPRQPTKTLRRRKAVKPSVDKRVGDASGTQTTQLPTPSGARETPPTRPRRLASELLKRDWHPRTPLRRTLRWGSTGLGTIGACGIVLLGGLAPEAIGLAGLFALCAVAGLAPLTPEARGGALALIGGAGLTWIGWIQAVDSAATPLLIACVTLTASALFFRAAHPVSRFARVLVGVGLFATASWIVLTGGIDALVVESLAWQAWLGPISRLGLGLVALLALVSFLDPSEHGGSWVAGFALLAWLALDVAGTVLVAAFPLRGVSGFEAGSWIAPAAVPLFAAVAAGGLCQMWVMISARTASRASSQP